MLKNHFIAIICFALLLSGCQPSVEEQSVRLAMSKTQIEALSDDKRALYLNTAQSNMNTRRYAQLFSRTKQAPALTITASHGSAALGPTYQQAAFETATIELPGNHCVDMVLKKPGSENHSTPLTLCYLDDKLYVDPSSIDENYPIGSMIIPVDARLVDRQKFCQVNTKGDARLRGACLLVQQQIGTTQTKRPVQLVNHAPKNKHFSPKPREESYDYDDDV